MKVCSLGLVLLSVLCVLWLADAQTNTRYQRFKNNHVYGSMTISQCDSVISKRHISEGDTNNCKAVNSFILANDKQINAVCTGAGTPQGGNLFKSNQPFSVITCKLRSGERHPNCVYHTGVKSSRYIVLGCDNGLPTHYEEGVVPGK